MEMIIDLKRIIDDLQIETDEVKFVLDNRRSFDACYKPDSATVRVDYHRLLYYDLFNGIISNGLNGNRNALKLVLYILMGEACLRENQLGLSFIFLEKIAEHIGTLDMDTVRLTNDISSYLDTQFKSILCHELHHHIFLRNPQLLTDKIAALKESILVSSKYEYFKIPVDMGHNLYTEIVCDCEAASYLLKTEKEPQNSNPVEFALSMVFALLNQMIIRFAEIVSKTLKNESIEAFIHECIIRGLCLALSIEDILKARFANRTAIEFFEGFLRYYGNWKKILIETTNLLKDFINTIDPDYMPFGKLEISLMESEHIRKQYDEFRERLNDVYRSIFGSCA